jgi:teichuronic acid exporter
MKDRIAKSFFWIVWSEATVRVISSLSTLIVMRFLTPKEYGLMALAGVSTHVVTMVSSAGLGSAVVRFRDLGQRELNSCFWLNVGLATLGYGALCAAAPFIAAWFKTPGLTDLLRIVGFSLPLIAMRVVPAGLLTKKLQYDKICKAEILSLAVSSPAVLALAWSGAGVWSLAIGVVVANLVEGLLIFWFVSWRPGFQVGGQKFREVLKFSWATLGGRVFWALYHQSDRVILGKISGEISVGLYAVARQLASLPVSKIHVVINKLAVPVMAELQDDLDALRKALLRSIRLVTWVVAPICIGLILAMADFVSIALPDKWSGLAPIVQLLCLRSLMSSVTELLPPVLLARNRADFMFWYNLTLLAVMPGLFWLGASWSGALGLALVWAVIFPIFQMYMAYEVFKEVKLTSRVLCAQLWRPLVAVIVMIGAVLVVRVIVTEWSYAALPRLILTVLTGAAAYGAAFLWIGGRVRDEIWEAASWIIFRDTRIARAANRG